MGSDAPPVRGIVTINARSVRNTSTVRRRGLLTRNDMVAINTMDAAGLQVGRLRAAQRTQWRHGDRRRLRSGERPLLYSWVGR
jgi:hypothetical protein